MAGLDKRIGIPTDNAIKLRELLREVVVERYTRDMVLLLSGGIDSSALAASDPRVPAYTTSLEGTRLDGRFAGVVARHLGLEWRDIVVNQEEAVFNLKEVIRLSERYDEAILNDTALYIAIKTAIIERGTRTVRSGEVADTYFRGYYHTYDGINTAFEIGRLPIRPALPLDAVESKLGLTVDYPYLDPRVRNFAMTLSREENVITRDVPGAFSDTPPGKGTLKNPAYILGKLALRRAMIGILPDEIVSRIKTEIEFGSGMANLRPYLRRQLGEGQREELEETDGVHFRNNAHAGIYVLYREAGLKPKPPKEGEYACTWCGGGVSFGPNGDNKYCSTCGAYPANKLPESH